MLRTLNIEYLKPTRLVRAYYELSHFRRNQHALDECDNKHH